MNIIENIYQQYLKSSGVTTDTREIEPNSIFFALKGDNFDGNAFASKALNKGAMLAIIDDDEFQCGQNCILVEDSLACLQALATHHRKQLQIPVIGLTGTNGKTTSKELIYRVLARKFKTHATTANYNNHIGVPLTILGIKKDTEIAVIEMGANHIGEIATLCEIALPDRGMITNIGKAHLEGFGGIEGVIKAKSELYDFLRRTEGTAFVNADDSLLLELSQGIKQLTYGENPGANQHGNIHSSFPYLEIEWKEKLISTQLYGDYNFYNVMAAIVIGFSFEIPAEDIVDALQNYLPTNNRSQIIQRDNNTIYLDAYNANPSSMALAINHFAKLKAGKKVLILGDMLELGENEIEEHKDILQQVENGFDELILVGPVFSKVAGNQNIQVFADTSTAAKWLEKHPINDAHILMKASRGIAIEKLVDLL